MTTMQFYALFITPLGALAAGVLAYFWTKPHGRHRHTPAE